MNPLLLIKLRVLKAKRRYAALRAQYLKATDIIV